MRGASPARADEFLRWFHDAHPGATTRGFADARDGGGRSSYDRLAERVLAGDRGRGDIVDLGCGDGYLLERLRQRGVPAGRLVGIDMSAGELARARARPALAGVRLLHERATAMSAAFAAPGAAAVCSHLGFMVMGEPEAVVAEIARVLAPGGRFATIVGGGPSAEDPVFERFLALLQAACVSAGVRSPRLGHLRQRSDSGLRALFGPHSGFVAEVEIDDFVLALDGSVGALWQRLASAYELALLSDAQRAALRARFEREVARFADGRGVIPCRAAMRQVVCRRRS